MFQKLNKAQRKRRNKAMKKLADFGDMSHEIKMLSVGNSYISSVKNEKEEKYGEKKLGSHSVLLTGVTGTSAMSIPSSNNGLDNYYNLMQSFIKTPQNDVHWDDANHGYRVRSRVARSMAAGILDNQVEIPAYTSVSLAPASIVRAVDLVLIAPIKTDMIPEEDLVAFAPNGNLNTKAFENIFIAPLQAAEPARRQIIIGLSDYWNTK